MRFKTVGILGGMGPEAGAEMYMEIVRGFQKKYYAKYDADFPTMVLYSLPLPDIVEELFDENKEKLGIKMLVESVQKLENAGAEFIVIACNSVQVYLDLMRKNVSIPILSVAKEVVREIVLGGFIRAGLLGTETTISNGLFSCECARAGIEMVLPDGNQQKVVTQIIMNILSGKKMQKDKLRLRRIISAMRAKGAECVILGCTELPLLLKQKDCELKVFDTTKVLGQAVVRESVQNLFKQTSVLGE